MYTQVAQLGRMPRKASSNSSLPCACSMVSSSTLVSKWSSIARLELPVMNTSVSAPADSASSTAYWISGLSTIGSISFGLALVMGRNLVPRPATGNTAVLMALLGMLDGFVEQVANDSEIQPSLTMA